MTKLVLAKKDMFGENEINIYRNENNEVFMTAKQLGEVLEYKHPQRSINKFFEKNTYLEKPMFSVRTELVATDGKTYNTRLLTEDGIYEVTMLSKQPKAQEFRFFIRELLKGLRKGELTIQGNVQPMASYMIEDPIQRAERWIEEQKEKLALEQENQKLVPLATYTTDVLKSENTINSTTIGKEYGISAQKLNALLKEMGVHYKRGSIWHLYAKYHDQDYKRTETYLNNGKTYESNSWTQKGRKFIVDSLKDLDILTLKQGGKDSPKRVNHILKFGLEDYKENYK